MRTSESVNGTIIGDITFKFALIAPNGSEITHVREDCDFDAVTWAKDELAKLKNTVLGDGSTYHNYPELLKEIYGDGEFELRSHNVDSNICNLQH